MKTEEKNHHIWGVWARTLQALGLKDIVAALLDAVGPLSLIGAQAIYIAQPTLGSLVPSPHLNAIAELLEDPDETHSFAEFLRGAS